MFTRSLTLLFLLTCTVSAFAAVSVSVAPASAAIAVGGTLQFVATVSGTTTTTVTWSVDGIAGGDATVGTISATGLYTAPAAAGTHAIKSTSTADATKSATATTTVFDAVSVDFGSRTNTTQRIPANMFGAQLSTFRDWPSIGLVTQAGITGTRLYANIDTVYATQTPDWTKIDPVIQQLKNAGIRPILQIAYTPSWLQPSPNPCQGLTDLFKAPPTDVNAWANIAASYVTHMNATFPGFITDYEIWNEPDNQYLMCVSDNTDATRRTTYFNIYAAAGPAMRAAAGSSNIRIGGPALSSPDQHWSTWIQPFVNNSSLAPYIDFVSYHHYFGYKNNLTWDTGADTLYSRTQGSYRGVISIYNRIANIVKAGIQPNAASTPIYLDEYNTTSDPTVDCCRSNSNYSPVWNALLVADLLNSAYQGAPHLPGLINYYSMSNPSSQACLFGVINVSMDCTYPTSGSPTPYPQYYAYKLLATSNYLGLGSGGYAAASVSPPATQNGIVVAGFYSPNKDGVLLVNPTATNYSQLTVNFNNPGFAFAGATGFLLNSANSNISTQAITVTSTASGFSASVSLAPYSVFAVSLVQQSGPPPVSVSISPTSASIVPGGTQQFQASVTNATDTSVTWSVDGVNGGNSTVGTVSTAGLYTAPATTGNHTVKATSNADNTKSASAAVAVSNTPAVTVTISPVNVTLAKNATQQFQASVTGSTNTAVKWSVDGVVGGNKKTGTVSTTGLYKAPNTLGNHTVKATSNADPTKSASAAVTVAILTVAVTISPTSVTLDTGATQQFQATVTGSTNTGVVWSVDGVNAGNSTSGTVSTTGLYTAPSTNGSHTVTATSKADSTKSASAIVTVSGISVKVTPSTVGVTFTQPQQFLATLTNTTNTAVTWSVDGVAGGNATAGTIDSTGLYTPPQSTGPHSVAATSVANPSKVGTAQVIVTNHPGVFTYYMDNNRSGANTSEIVLSPSNVNSTQFGMVFAYNVDGNVFAEPLYVPNLQLPGVGYRNVVFVATEHDSIYAFDADGRQTAPYWHTSLINPSAGITTIPATDLPTVLVGTEIGITSTPVIDPNTGTIYLIAATKENGSYFHRLHALDITTGAEKFSGPTTIEASVPGTGDGSVNGTLAFNPLMHLQRGAVTLSNGVIYATWASHADTPPYHGWIMAFDATHLNLLAAFASSPNTGYGGIWQAGCGPAADSAGNVYFVTGNAAFTADSGGTEYGDTVIKAHVTSAGFTVDDWFTPTNQSYLNTNDLDLGSTCTLLVPATQSGSHPNLLIAGGKQNRVYVLDRDNLGRFNSTSDANALQVFTVAGTTWELMSHAAYWNGNLFFEPAGDFLKAYTLANGLVSSSPTSIATNNIGFPGASPVVSANGSTNGLVWILQRGNGELHAYDATNVANKLFSSPYAGVQVKFAIPTVVNGKVYVGTNNQLVVFGLLGK